MTSISTPLDMDNDNYQVEFTDPLLFTPFPLAPTQNVRDPYSDYAQFLKEKPIHEAVNALDPSGLPAFYVYGREAVAKVLLNHETFSSTAMKPMFEPLMGNRVILAMDEPDHHRYRTLVNPLFTPKAIKRWQDTIIQPIVDDMITKMAPAGYADLAKIFTFLFPARVISEIMGLDKMDFKNFFQWATDILCMIYDPAKAISAAENLQALFAREVAKRREAPRDDLITDLINTELNGRALENEEIYSFLRFLLPAGIETTYRSSGSYLYHLLNNPDQLEQTRQNSNLIANGFEEALRMEPPLPYFMRSATHETELYGTKIPKGAMVYAVIPSSSRDANILADPDRFNILRPRDKHMAFGYGIHICLGMHLARLEVKVAIETLLKRLPNLRWDSDKATAIDAHMHGTAFRAPTALPVIWDI